MKSENLFAFLSLENNTLYGFEMKRCHQNFEHLNIEYEYAILQNMNINHQNEQILFILMI
jgi:hypothetical protein